MHVLHWTTVRNVLLSGWKTVSTASSGAMEKLRMYICRRFWKTCASRLPQCILKDTIKHHSFVNITTTSWIWMIWTHQSMTNLYWILTYYHLAKCIFTTTITTTVNQTLQIVLWRRRFFSQLGCRIRLLQKATRTRLCRNTTDCARSNLWQGKDSASVMVQSLVLLVNVHCRYPGIKKVLLPGNGEKKLFCRLNVYLLSVD